MKVEVKVEDGGRGGGVGWRWWMEVVNYNLGARCRRVGGSSRSRVRRESLAVSMSRSLQGELITTDLAMFFFLRYHFVSWERD